MSGRGTITSRTTVSPNSMIEWMRARSSVSMTSPSRATSAMASSSDSVTSDPRYWPFSPMRRLARPIRAPDTIRTGQNRTMADTSGALNRAARSGWWTAQFFGTASPRTKMTTISNTVAATTPQAPNQSAARIPTRVATTSWQMSTIRSTGLRKPWGFSVSRSRTLAPRRPSSTRAIALARLVRTRLVSARASRAETPSRTTTTTMRTPSTAVKVAAASGPARAAHVALVPGSGGSGGVPITRPRGRSEPAAAARVAPCVRPRRRPRGPCPADGGCRGPPAGRSRRRR